MSYDDPQGKLFIGGISWETTDEEFLSFFQEFGVVTDHIIMRKPDGQSRGFGFVTFDDPNDAQKVISQDLRLGGRRIDCKPAVPRTGNNSHSRGGGNNSYGGNSYDNSYNSGGDRYGRRSRSSRGPRTCKIFVGGLSRDTHKDEFEEYFTQFGRVVDAIVMLDRETQRSRGFGFVTYDNESSVESVLSQKVHVITDKTVECKRAIPKESMSEPSSKDSNTGGYGGYNNESGGYGGGNYSNRSTHDHRGYGATGTVASTYTPTPYPQVTTAYGGVTPATYPQVSSDPMMTSYSQYPTSLNQSQAQLPQTLQGQAITPYSSYAVSTPYVSPSVTATPGVISQSDSQGSYGAVSRGRDVRSFHPYGRR